MQNPPKRWEIFTSKKICEGVYGFTKIFQWSCWKNDGGDIDLEVLARELEGIKRAFYRKWKRRKRKKREVREWAGQRDEKMSDCVVGSGVRWGLARGNPKQISDLDPFFLFLFYFIADWDVTCRLWQIFHLVLVEGGGFAAFSFPT